MNIDDDLLDELKRELVRELEVIIESRDPVWVTNEVGKIWSSWTADAAKCSDGFCVITTLMALFVSSTGKTWDDKRRLLSLLDVAVRRILEQEEELEGVNPKWGGSHE